ncbi:MAG TPA: transaldolase family protein [Candidatus Lokiarchaeia archaeon]|nr:transaldolase family protein [Candidatus Lokiarchaeia archaeon]
MSQEYKSKLHETVTKFPQTDVWNDSCSIEELSTAIETSGAVGATSNPVIVGEVLKKEMNLWTNRINELVAEDSDQTEIDITWRLIEEVATKAAQLLEPVFEQFEHKKGRLSIQTNPIFYRNCDAIIAQAEHFSTLYPNVQVKIPVTKAGIKAIEEVSAKGININATVCFTVPQAIAVAEAVEYGLQRREADGEDVSGMTPVCTIMVGRLDDWLKAVANKENIITDPGNLEWAGVAAMKRAYGIYKERGYRTRLLAAAYRNHYHWSEFIGADMVLTIPFQWQKRFNASDIEVKSRIDDPVDQKIVDDLYTKFAEFRKAYDEDGMSVEEFDTYGACVRTLRGFIKGYEELIGIVRDRMLPDLDK